MIDAPTHRPQRAPDLSVILGPFTGRCPLTMNRLPHRHEQAKAKRRIRADVIRELRAQAVPLGAEFVRAALLYHPPTATRPDPNNLLPTLKPVVDALQPTITTSRSTAPGYGLIVDERGVRWSIISRDGFRKQKGAERQVQRQLGLSVFVLQKSWSSRRYWEMTAQFVHWWPRIVEHACATERVAMEIPWSISGRFQQI